MRRLIIRGETWGWRFGREISIATPRGGRFKVDLPTFNGVGWDEVERGFRKKYFGITPSQVVEYINRTLLGYTDISGFPQGVLPRNWSPPVREGCHSVEGPRGLWQWKPAPWLVELRSPEDVAHVARIYHLHDMTVDEWADLKVAAIVASGSSVDQEMLKAKAEHGYGCAAKGFFEWEGPGLPSLTNQHVAAYLNRLIAGVPEKTPATQ
ncbi:hypothetical protein [Sphingomonas sp. 3-13AW]|uniref:hypothetical protein n=1 Tax=Sphingomonas sp. 3-13AW TaxID=3050450 RepID=UPI003BB6806B